jgi:hypothetical protein
MYVGFYAHHLPFWLSCGLVLRLAWVGLLLEVSGLFWALFGFWRFRVGLGFVGCLMSRIVVSLIEAIFHRCSSYLSWKSYLPPTVHR